MDKPGVAPNIFSTFSQGLSGSTQFLQSNTIVAKLGFLILVIILFIVLLVLGIMLITYLTSPAKDPYLIYGMMEGSTTKTISQDPNNSASIPVLRSNNENEGLEFTWSFWIYIDNLPDTTVLGKPNTTKQCIFCKGDGKVNNGPGVYLGTDMSNATLQIIMDTVIAGDTNNKVNINNIPLKNWVHIDIRCEQTVLDVYVNGVIASRLALSNLPKQNYNDVVIAQGGGFSGKLSNLRYYSHALNIFEINYLVYSGPNKSLINSTKASVGSSYLSRNWYSSKV